MKKKIHLFPVILFTAVLTLIGFSASRILLNAFAGETNADLIEFVTHPCEPIPMSVDRRMAVLRIDDVQAFAWSEISRQMINDAHSRKIVPVLGVIPQGLEDDKETYLFLRSMRCNVEVALHGWGNQDSDVGEFANLSRNEAENLIKKGRAVLEILTRKNITTFIPPNNELSAETKELLDDSRIAISSFGDQPFDFAATTFDFVSDTLVAPQQVVTNCESKLSTSELCVIMVHPQDFATAEGSLDVAKYAHYLDMLDGILANDIRFVTFEYLVDHDWKPESI